MNGWMNGGVDGRVVWLCETEEEGEGRWRRMEENISKGSKCFFF